MQRTSTILKGLVLLVLVFGFVGCDTLESINPFDNDKEVTGVIEQIDNTSLTVEGIAYAVTDKTEFEGITGLADLSVGDEVGIEYEESGSTRTALEIELGDGTED